MTTAPLRIKPTWHRMTSSADLLGESPFWHPADNNLYWLDIPGKRLRRMPVSQDLTSPQKVEDWSLDQEPGCFAPAEQGGWVLALRSGMYRAQTWGGPLTLLAPAPYDTSRLRFNDGKCDAQGRFWAGSLYEPKDQVLGTLYMLDGQGLHAMRLAGLHHGIGVLPVALVGDGHVVAALGQHERGGRTHTTGTAGHNGHALGLIHAHVPFKPQLQNIAAPPIRPRKRDALRLGSRWSR